MSLRSKRLVDMVVQKKVPLPDISLTNSEALRDKDAEHLSLLNVPNYETKGTLESERNIFFHSFIEDTPKEPFSDSGSEYIPSSVKSDSEKSTISEITNTEEVTAVPKLKESHAKYTALDIENKISLLLANGIQGTKAQNKKSKMVNKTKSVTTRVIKESKVQNIEEIKERKQIIFDQNQDVDDKYLDEREKITLNIVKKNVNTDKMIRDKYHICFFCEFPIKNCARHFELMHGDELQIAKILAKPKRSKERKEAFGEIIRAGDFLHNCNILALKSGELVLVRRPSLAEYRNLTYASYGPCPECLGFMVKKQIWRHLKYFCPKNRNNIFNQLEQGRRPIQESTALLNGIFQCEYDNTFKTEILEKLRHDEIGIVCKEDDLIKRYGYFMFEKFGASQHELVRQSMRQIARLLIQLKQIDPEIKSLRDSLFPVKFDRVVEATRFICTFEHNSVMRPEFKTPSLALKIGHALKKCINVERGAALRLGDIKNNEAFLNFGHLLEMEWCTLISSNALSTLHKRKFNSTELLPLTSDITKLSRYLDSEIKISCDALEKSFSTSFSTDLYFKLSRLTLSKIVVFNKRRSGEASKMTVGQYLSRPENANTEVFSEALSPLEKKLASNLAIVEIQGKRGRKVPVLLTSDLITAINLLIRYRSLSNIPPDNPFIFAPAKSCTGHFRGHDCLKFFCNEADLHSPEYITSTKLRKYVATVAQIFNMKENEYDWLARHMGHDIKVHRDFYRLHQNTIELTKVSRLLLAIDTGQAHKYAGKSLNEISVEDLDGVEVDDEPNENDDDEFKQDNNNESVLNGNNEPREIDELSGPSTPMNKTSKKNKSSKQQKRRKTCTKKPWSQEEIAAVLKFFKIHIRKNILPGKKECEECKLQNSELSSRTWTDIKFYIKNYYTRQKNLTKKA